MRGELPAKGLNENGWLAGTCDILFEHENGKYQGYSTATGEPFLNPDIIIGRPMLCPDANGNLVWGSNRDVILEARKHGQKYLHDLDDDIWNIPPWNPQHNNPNGIPGHMVDWLTDINSGDGLIVSTIAIKRSAIANGVKVPIYVCPNSVIVDDEIVKRPDHYPLRVAWLGDVLYRQKDFELLLPLLEQWGSSMPNIQFWHVGANYDQSFIDLYKQLFRPGNISLVERPWVRIEYFTRFLAENIDIVLIPARDHKFNHGRSNIVGLHCMAAGVPFLSSPIAEYSSFILGMDAITTDWVKDTYKLVRDRTMRDDFRKTAVPIARDRFNPSRIACHYIEDFERVLNG